MPSLLDEQRKTALRMRQLMTPTLIAAEVYDVSDRATKRQIEVAHGTGNVTVDVTGDFVDYQTGAGAYPDHIYITPLNNGTGMYRSIGFIHKGTASPAVADYIPPLRTNAINTTSDFSINIGGADEQSASTVLAYDSGTSEWQWDGKAFLSEKTFSGKGQLLTASAADTLSVLNVGSDGTFLISDSSQAAGLKWTGTLTETATALVVNNAQLEDKDFIFKGGTDAQLFVVDFLADEVAIGGAAVAGQKATIYTVSTTNVGLVVKGAAAQTADLIQAQDSAGNEWFSVGVSDFIVNEVGADRDGRIEGSSDTNLIVWDGGEDAVSIGGAVESGVKLKVYGRTHVVGTVTDQYGFTLSGTVSVGSDYKGLMQVQANLKPTAANLRMYGQVFTPTFLSSSSDVNWINALFCRTDTAATYTGNIASVRGLALGNPIHSGSGTIGTIYQILISQPTSATTNYAIYSSGGASFLLAGTAAVTPLTLKGAASQTGDLTEWQNSAGTALMEVEASGEIDFRWAMGDSAKDPTSDAPADWVQVKISGTSYYLPAYAAA